MTTPTPLIIQAVNALDRYASQQQIPLTGKDTLSVTIARIVADNRDRWGEYADADPITGVSDQYVDDVVYHYLTQRRLLRSLKNQHEAAWQDVIDHLTVRINSRLYTHSNVRPERIADLTLDLVQHCAIVIWLRLDAFTFDCSFWSWVEVLSAREMRNYLRKADYRHNSQAARLDDVLEAKPLDRWQKTVFNQIDSRLLLESLLPHLPADQQLAVSLTLKGYASDEIAELMGRTVSAVHSLRSRAYEGLREASAEEVVHG